MTALVSHRSSISVAAATLAILSITSPAAPATELIRCPDWQRYVAPAAALRTTPPKQSFAAALATNRTRESRLASANTRAALRAEPTRIPVSMRSSPPRATTESGAPLLLPEGFLRNAQPESAAQTCQYTVLAGDTLSKIAAAKLGNDRRWPELAKANALGATSILRIGQSLHLPCAPDRQPERLQRGSRGQQPERVQRGDSPTPAAAPAPLPAVRLPVWTARPDEFVSDVITRWAKRAGHTVVRDGVEEWKISVPVSIRGSFKHALDQLVVGFEGSGRPLAISIYANKVIRIGRPL